MELIPPLSQHSVNDYLFWATMAMTERVWSTAFAGQLLRGRFCQERGAERWWGGHWRVQVRIINTLIVLRWTSGRKKIWPNSGLCKSQMRSVLLQGCPAWRPHSDCDVHSRPLQRVRSGRQIWRCCGLPSRAPTSCGTPSCPSSPCPACPPCSSSSCSPPPWWTRACRLPWINKSLLNLLNIVVNDNI